MPHRRHLTPIAVAAVLAISPTHAQTTVCATLMPDGFASTSGYSTAPSMSADGGRVAFLSTAPLLGVGGMEAVYVRDIATGSLVCASLMPNGMPAAASAPRISADGRWVTFSSISPNLVTGDTDLSADVFLRDLVTGTLTLLSVTSSGAQVSSVVAMPTSISADGRFVAFDTYTAFDPADTNSKYDVYVRDTLAGITFRASVGSSGQESAGDCYSGSISADGQRIAFAAEADDLGPGDQNGVRDVLLRDRVTASTQIVSLTSSGGLADGTSGLPSISGDGTTVAFFSAASNLTAPAALTYHVYAHDLTAGFTTLVDVDSAGIAGISQVVYVAPACSHDGRFVVFTSTASNLVQGDTNGTSDTFLRDRLAGLTILAGRGAVDQQADTGTGGFGISTDGRFIGFGSIGANLAPGDVNQGGDMFVRDLAGIAPGATTCFGDGTGAVCPCGNSGGPGRGCEHATEAAGAELFALGIASVSNDTLRLGARGLPNVPLGMFLQGTSALGGGAGVAFGDGLRCVGGAVVRLAPLVSSGAREAHCPTPGQPSISVRGLLPPAGATRLYQVWYRSTPVFCTAATFNLTNAVRIDWSA
jgi:Tol biopolymer transport system component